MIKDHSLEIPKDFIPALGHDFVCESPLNPHAPCKERIAQLERELAQIRMEIINEIVREEIAQY